MERFALAYTLSLLLGLSLTGCHADGDNSDNILPVTADDSFSTSAGQSAIIDVLANDRDGNGDTLAIESFTQPSNGTVTDNGDGTLAYSADADFLGTDSFSYTVSDGRGGVSTGTVVVTVTFPGGLPIERVSVSSTGDEAEGALANTPCISGDGRYVVFTSSSRKLAEFPVNSNPHVFLRDRFLRVTALTDLVNGSAQPMPRGAGPPSISSDGRYATFGSSNDNSSPTQIYVHDRQVGSTEVVTVNGNGSEADNHSFYPWLSSDGRYVAFMSFASNLVEGDANGTGDIFVHDRKTRETTRVSVATGGKDPNGFSYAHALSADGRYVAFTSWATNLVTGDTNGVQDVFVHDRLKRQTNRISVASDGTEANALSEFPSVSGDGRYIAFQSKASNLVPGDKNGFQDIFVYDQQMGRTTRVSLASDGSEGNGDSSSVSISADGRFIAFESLAFNLVTGDGNSRRDIFVRNQFAGEIVRVNVALSGREADNYSATPSISADGRYVAFQSPASNLVPGDTNRSLDVFVVSNPLAR